MRLRNPALPIDADHHHDVEAGGGLVARPETLR
jgi:hypothetical protein